MVWACDQKRGALCRKEGGGNESTRKKEGLRELDRVRDDVKEKGLSVEEVYDRATRRRMSSYIDPT